MDIKKELKAALAEMFAPETTEAKSTPKFAFTVNNKLMQNRMNTRAEIVKAATAIKVRNPEAVIGLYEYVGDVNLDIPVNVPATSSDDLEEAEVL